MCVTCKQCYLINLIRIWPKKKSHSTSFHQYFQTGIIWWNSLGICVIIALSLGSRPVIWVVKHTRMIKMCQDIFFFNWPLDLWQIWHWIEGVRLARVLCLKYIMKLVIILCASRFRYKLECNEWMNICLTFFCGHNGSPNNCYI